MRVLMYSPDSIGLGHMRRNSTIAAEIVAQCHHASVALLIGSGAGAYFAVPKGVDTIKLPSVQKVAADNWQPRSLNMSVRETVKLRASIIRNVVLTMKPDLLLVDHVPMGVCKDLLPALDAIRSHDLPTKVVLGLRDILDEPEVIRQRWRAQGQYSLIAEHYDHILIYGNREIFASGDHYGLAECCRGGLSYVGFVCSAADSGRIARGNRAGDLQGLCGLQPLERVVLAAGGGGHDAYPMLSKVVEALAGMDGDPSLRGIVVAGPLMPEEDRNRLLASARSLSRTRVLSWTSDLMDYLGRADVAIVMAGYNSSLEALATSARVVMMPRQGPSGEQRLRASLLARMGHVTAIEPDAATPALLRDAIVQSLASGPRDSSRDLMSGGANAARLIIDIVARRRPRQQEFTAQRQVSPYVVF